MTTECVLVVGTTADYIDILWERFARRVLFLTDSGERLRFPAADLPPDREVTAPLDDPAAAAAAVAGHLRKYDLRLKGVTCYDCESLHLASLLAASFNLSFCPPSAVLKSRSKYLSKILWQGRGISCPRVMLAKHEDDVIRFQAAIKAPVVLKPLTGSGSELIFLACGPEEARRAYQCLVGKLAAHPDKRMYMRRISDGEDDPQHDVVVEEFIGGDEFSCDLALEGDCLEILRLTEKIPLKSSSFGTMMAYRLPGRLPGGVEKEALKRLLRAAADALGIGRALCMVDFKIAGGRAFLIEMTPRIGGDCLPPLIHAGSGLDMLGAAVNFAEGKPVAAVDEDTCIPMVGLHLLAGQAGVIKELDVSALAGDPRVVRYHVRRKAGDRIVLPPDDYASRNMGYAVFRPAADVNLEFQCLELMNKVRVTLEKVDEKHLYYSKTV